MSSNSANILIAFIAIFDTFVGGVAWSFMAYLLHWYRADNLAHDGLYHQHQVLLRNSQSAASFVTQSIQAGWRWRRSAPRALLRGVILSLLPLGTGLAFTLAGIFSSQIANTGEVLLQGGDCGSVVIPGTLSGQVLENLQAALVLESAQATDVSQAYAQVCYNNSLTPGVSVISNQLQAKGSCDYFVQSQLKYNVTLGLEDCPFQSLCSVPNSQVLSLDTGYLDSLAHLGQNQPVENRVQFRRKQTCSPIVANFTLNNIEGLEKLGNVTAWYYGTNALEPTSFLNVGYFDSSEGLPGITFIYPEASYYAADDPYLLRSASTLNFALGGPQPVATSAFTPSAGLISDATAPISLIFLANRALYWDEVDDPWFNATSLYTFKNGESTMQWFQNSYPGSVLACLEQGQICNPNAPGGTQCTDMDSWYTWVGIPDAFYEIGLNDAQIATASGIHNALLSSTAQGITAQLGSSSLLASQYFADQDQGFSPALPSNQWQIEVANWFGIGLAGIQSQYVSSPRKPTSNIEAIKYWQPWGTDDTLDQSLCSSQKVRDTAYQSFSVLGLVLNFIIGGAMIVGSYMMTEILPELRRSQRTKLPRQQWIANGSLQLHRVAYERLLRGDWEGNESEVPTTRKGQTFKAYLLGIDEDSPSMAMDGLGGRPTSQYRSLPTDPTTSMLTSKGPRMAVDDEESLN